MTLLDYLFSRPLTIRLTKDEDGDIVAHVKELPGCSTHGQTRLEALANIDEAIQLYLESLAKDPEGILKTTILPPCAVVLSIEPPECTTIYDFILEKPVDEICYKIHGEFLASTQFIVDKHIDFIPYAPLILYAKPYKDPNTDQQRWMLENITLKIVSEGKTLKKAVNAFINAIHLEWQTLKMSPSSTAATKFLQVFRVSVAEDDPPF